MRIYLRYCENVDDIAEATRHLLNAENDPSRTPSPMMFVLSDVVWDLRLRRLEGSEFHREYKDSQRPVWKIESVVTRALNGCDVSIVELWNKYPHLNFLDQPD